MPQQLLFLELNEINFENVAYYCERGLLPNFTALFEENGWCETVSEDSHEEFEPWIQWVTAHTGRTLREHGVFRLGDIVSCELPQIWEQLEDLGFKVGALSPMNARHRVRAPAFFVPDPWTRTDLTAGKRLRNLYTAISQAVNDNAQARLTIRSAFRLFLGFLLYSSVAHYTTYLWLAASSIRSPWRRALLLDLLLTDVFISEVKRAKPDFATIFLNAGAHIQHHYLFSAACHEGEQRNPAWYLRGGADPVREAYELYDGIIGAIRKAFPAARIMIATALHQVPHGEVTYYWRLRRHEEFLARIRVPFVGVQPRMSRDFLVVCASPDQAWAAARRLSSAISANGTPLFAVDNRGTDLFVILSYPHDVSAGVVFRVEDDEYWLSRDDVVFVALKNGEHSGIGYFVDTNARFQRDRDTFPLSDIPRRIKSALGVKPAQERGATLCGDDHAVTPTVRAGAPDSRGDRVHLPARIR